MEPEKPDSTRRSDVRQKIREALMLRALRTGLPRRALAYEMSAELLRGLERDEKPADT